MQPAPGYLANVTGAGVTVKVVLPEMPVMSDVAVIPALPAATIVARPSEPVSLLTIAIAVSDELQITDFVASTSRPFSNVPFALN